MIGWVDGQIHSLPWLGKASALSLGAPAGGPPRRGTSPAFPRGEQLSTLTNTLVHRYLQANHHSRVSLSVLVHPQYCITQTVVERHIGGLLEK